MPSPLELYNKRVKEGLLDADSDQKAAITELQRLYDELLEEKGGFFKKKKSPKGIYLWGGVGRGKSMAMDLFYECLPENIKKERIHFHEFMIKTHDFLHGARKEKASESAILRYAKMVSKNTDILCFDEFHVSDIADAMILGRLFTALFSKGLVVVGTSNFTPDKLYEGGLQRELFLPFIELLKNELSLVSMNGEIDYRMQCLEGTGVYFSPLGTASRKSADDVFNKLTDNIKPSQESLDVKGRSLEVKRCAKGVARFTFSELCEQPLGAEDYLMIANTFHTVFLEEVPRLKYDRRNEAKRLMTLVDALYDKGIKLIITADAPADELYLGRDHSFEFQRTVSRLIEMQGSEYLGL